MYSVSIISVRFIHVVAHIGNSTFFIATYYSTVEIYHNLFVKFPGHLCHYGVLSLVNKAAIDTMLYLCLLVNSFLLHLIIEV